MVAMLLLIFSFGSYFLSLMAEVRKVKCIPKLIQISKVRESKLCADWLVIKLGDSLQNKLLRNKQILRHDPS